MKAHWLVRCGGCGHVGKLIAGALKLTPRAGEGVESVIRRTAVCAKCGAKGRHRVTAMGAVAGRLVGAGLNVVSDPVYHRESCTWVARMNVNQLVEFSTQQEAVFRGYRPCKVCRPEVASA